MTVLFRSLSARKKHILLLVIIYIGFVSLGLPDTVLGVAWEPMHVEFEKPIYYAGFLTTLLTVCSAVSAFFSGAILRRTGTGKLLMICGFVTGISLLGYALSPAFWVLLLFAVPLGFGQGAVDTGMNYYVAKHYTSRDMSWLHCCWGLGASAGPMLVTMIITLGFTWRYGYGVIALVQLSLAILFLLTLSLWSESSGEEKKDSAAQALQGKVNYSLRFFCCPLMFFLYCGIEVSGGLWFYQFLTVNRGVQPATAGYAVAGYWCMLTAGRFLIGFIANRLGNRKQIRYSMVIGLAAGLLLLIPGSLALTLFSVGLFGFAMAPFYPAMMHAAPKRFDDATAATVIGWQGGAAMLGSAVIPAGFGYLAAHTTFGLLPFFFVGICLLLLLLQAKVDGWRIESSA